MLVDWREGTASTTEILIEGKVVGWVERESREIVYRDARTGAKETLWRDYDYSGVSRLTQGPEPWLLRLYHYHTLVFSRNYVTTFDVRTLKKRGYRLSDSEYRLLTLTAAERESPELLSESNGSAIVPRGYVLKKEARERVAELDAEEAEIARRLTEEKPAGKSRWELETRLEELRTERKNIYDAERLRLNEESPILLHGVPRSLPRHDQEREN